MTVFRPVAPPVSADEPPPGGRALVEGPALEETVLRLDEFESLRLADLDGLYQEQAAARMGISRSTFSRVVDSAHRKVADALVHGKTLRIEGGPIFEAASATCSCGGVPGSCPRCGAAALPEALPTPPCCGRRRGPRRPDDPGPRPTKGEVL